MPGIFALMGYSLLISLLLSVAVNFICGESKQIAQILNKYICIPCHYIPFQLPLCLRFSVSLFLCNVCRRWFQ